MVTLPELVDYTHALLDTGRFQDYCPNGLQVEGKREVHTLASGVTASLDLLDAAISAGAWHLPLDAHPELGNNAQLARVLGWRRDSSFGDDGGMQLGQCGRLEPAMSGPALAQHIQQCLGRRPLHIAAGQEPIRTVGWCTGAAQSYIGAAVERGLDAFVSGEISEQTVHVARECGIHYFAAGHHATERFGVQALGEHLAQHFELQHRFIDVDNPV
jgi:dinuclear metal center YbgI/SA1388 family protein